MQTFTVTSYEMAKDCYRNKDLRQALYDAGEVIMADVLVNLHGDAHRNRRRLENRLFRRDTFMFYERELFPEIIADTLAPHLAAGRCELVGFSHQLMMNLAALTAGVDRPQGTPEETFRLYDYLTTFIEGATLAHYTGDRAAKAREIEEKLDLFDAEFLSPGIARRKALLARAAAGEVTDDDLPRDVLTILLRNEDNLELTHEMIRREVAFYLLAGAHTSATAFTRVMHNIFTWIASHPEDEERVRTDRSFVQRATHETIRMQPSSPIGMRWVLADTTLRGGMQLSPGDKLVIDLLQINRDPSVFGEDADSFNPHRELPEGVSPWGLSFGGGMHACIGQDLAAGVVSFDDQDQQQHLFGLVPVAVQAMFDNGCRPDPDDPPETDSSTTRPYFGRYPVIFGQS
ncbi:MAG: cytochrome P450 [Acidimicrobiales bacterium]